MRLVSMSSPLDPARIVSVAILCNDPAGFILDQEFSPLVLRELAGSGDCVGLPIVQRIRPKNLALSSIELHAKNSAAAKVGGCRAAWSTIGTHG